MPTILNIAEKGNTYQARDIMHRTLQPYYYSADLSSMLQWWRKWGREE